MEKIGADFRQEKSSGDLCVFFFGVEVKCKTYSQGPNALLGEMLNLYILKFY